MLHLLGTPGEHLTAAVECFERAGEALRDARDDPGQVDALTGLALASAMLGAGERTRACHRVVVGILEAGGPAVPSATTWAVGIAEWRQNAAEPAGILLAAGLMEQALRLAHRSRDRLGIARSLEVMAWIAADALDARRAGTLLGASAGISRSVGAPGIPFAALARDHERCEDSSRRLIGRRAFAAAYRRGAELGPDQAVEYALAESSAVLTRSAARPRTTLTPREQKVAELVGQGMTNREIADWLRIGQRTVEGHVESILAKLGVTSRAQIAVWLIRRAGGGP
jgi:non-specific serine/threonine protein kinase